MRISDWSSDVCSSDLGAAAALRLAYREHGEGLFDHLTGAFALAILDSANRRALLAVDRMGVHGLYYAQPPGAGLVFGTTADMVRAHQAVGASVSRQAFYAYPFAFVCRSPGTLSAAQRTLGPAPYLLLPTGQHTVASCWLTPLLPHR